MREVTESWRDFTDTEKKFSSGDLWRQVLEKGTTENSYDLSHKSTSN